MSIEVPIESVLTSDSYVRINTTSYMRQDIVTKARQMAEEGFITRLLNKDFTLWGKEAEDEASKRLGWIDSVQKANDFIDDLYDYSVQLYEKGIVRVVLAGMGGSSLAPEVICNAYNRPLIVLDSTDPDQVNDAIDDLAHTVLVVSSKSGSTLETKCALSIFEQAFKEADLDPAKHIAVVTDPASPLENYAKEQGYKIFSGDAQVGGRFSALTAFGLVPSALAGVDVRKILEQARSSYKSLFAPDSPAVYLGLALSGMSYSQNSPKVDKAVLINNADNLGNFADWVEQLVAESTGKNNTGTLPVVCQQPQLTKTDFSDCISVLLGSDIAPSQYNLNNYVEISADLGTSFLLWEIATCVMGYQLGINPFDQPNVESAKAMARDILNFKTADQSPDYADQDIAVFMHNIEGSQTIKCEGCALNRLFDSVKEDGYLAVMVYGDRLKYEEVFSKLQAKLTNKLSRPVTIGFGPRFLHSTGQFHKGGTANGAFLQLVIEPESNCQVPGQNYDLRTVIMAQAEGDAKVLAETTGTDGNKIPVLRIYTSADEINSVLKNID